MPQSWRPNHRRLWVHKEEHPVSWDDSVLAATWCEAGRGSCGHQLELCACSPGPETCKPPPTRPRGAGPLCLLCKPWAQPPGSGSLNKHTRGPITAHPQAGMRTCPRCVLTLAAKEKSPSTWRPGSRSGALAVLNLPSLEDGESTAPQLWLLQGATAP